ncbi:MAG: hypothetical protein HYY63_04890, partial [Elusimicrobia bacterium]|nr:hypothetical protein [Elusimicrobiota bacterium]
VLRYEYDEVGLLKEASADKGISISDDGFGNMTESHVQQNYIIINGAAKVKKSETSSYTQNLDGSFSYMGWNGQGQAMTVIYNYVSDGRVSQKTTTKGESQGPPPTVTRASYEDGQFLETTAEGTISRGEIEIEGKTYRFEEDDTGTLVATHQDEDGITRRYTLEPSENGLALSASDGSLFTLSVDKETNRLVISNEQMTQTLEAAEIVVVTKVYDRAGQLIGASGSGTSISNDGFGNLTTSVIQQSYIILAGQAKLWQSATKTNTTNLDGTWSAMDGSVHKIDLNHDGDTEDDGETVTTAPITMTYEYDTRGKIGRLMNVTASEGVSINGDIFGNRTLTRITQTFSNPELTGGQAKILTTTSRTHTVNADGSWSRMDGETLDFDGERIQTQGSMIIYNYDKTGRLLGASATKGVSVSDDGFGSRTLSIIHQTFTDPALTGGQAKIASSETSSYTLNLDGSWSIMGGEALTGSFKTKMKKDFISASAELKLAQAAFDSEYAALWQEEKDLRKDLARAQEKLDLEVGSIIEKYESAVLQLQQNRSNALDSMQISFGSYQGSFESILESLKGERDTKIEGANKAYKDVVTAVNGALQGASERNLYLAYHEMARSSGSLAPLVRADIQNMEGAASFRDLRTILEKLNGGNSAVNVEMDKFYSGIMKKIGDGINTIWKSGALTVGDVDPMSDNTIEAIGKRKEADSNAWAEFRDRFTAILRRGESLEGAKYELKKAYHAYMETRKNNAWDFKNDMREKFQGWAEGIKEKAKKTKDSRIKEFDSELSSRVSGLESAKSRQVTSTKQFFNGLIGKIAALKTKEVADKKSEYSAAMAAKEQKLKAVRTRINDLRSNIESAKSKKESVESKNKSIENSQSLVVKYNYDRNGKLVNSTGENKNVTAGFVATGVGRSFSDDGFGNVTVTEITQNMSLEGGQAKIKQAVTSSHTQNLDGTESWMGWPSGTKDSGGKDILNGESLTITYNYNHATGRLKADANGFVATGSGVSYSADAFNNVTTARMTQNFGEVNGQAKLKENLTASLTINADMSWSSTGWTEGDKTGGTAVKVTYTYYGEEGVESPNTTDKKIGSLAGASGFGSSFSNDGFGNVTRSNMTQVFKIMNGQAKMAQSVTASFTENLDGSKSWMGWPTGEKDAQGKDILKGEAMTVSYSYWGEKDSTGAEIAVDGKLSNSTDRKSGLLAKATGSGRSISDDGFKNVTESKISQSFVILNGQAKMSQSVSSSFTENQDGSKSWMGWPSGEKDRSGKDIIKGEAMTVSYSFDGATGKYKADADGFVGKGRGVSLSDDSFGNITTTTIGQYFKLEAGQAKMSKNVTASHT